ncbi:MAG: zinc ribbon domain-containing protein [Candidatus Micrarchaeota archaeon]
MGLFDLLFGRKQERMDERRGPSKPRRCYKCGARVGEKDWFCKKCGFQVKELPKEKEGEGAETYRCPRCGFVMKTFMTSCPSCGIEFI